MVDGAFCGDCGVAIAVDDRFCGECGASQEIYATTSDGEESFPAEVEENLHGTTNGETSHDTTTGTAGLIADTEPEPNVGSAAKSSSLGFLDAAGIAMELIVRGIYIVLCGALAVLAFQNGEPLIGGGAIAYGLYVLAGGKWFVY